MKNITPYILGFLLTLSCLPAFAQKNSTLVLYSGDTLRGTLEIKRMNLPNMKIYMNRKRIPTNSVAKINVMRKLAPRQQKKKMALERYEQFRVKVDTAIDGSRVTASNITFLPSSYKPLWRDQQVFLRLIVKGEISLYEYIDEEKKLHYFIKERDGIPYELLRGYITTGQNRKEVAEYRNQLLKLISKECPKTTQAFSREEIQFGPVPFRKLITKLNTLCTEKAPLYVHKNERVEVHSGFFTAFGVTQIRFTGNHIPLNTRVDGISPLTMFHWQVGGHFDFIIPKTRGLFSFRQEVNLDGFSVSPPTHIFDKNGAIQQENTHTLSIVYLRLSPMLHIRLANYEKPVQPYFQVGAGYGIALLHKAETEVVERRQYQTDDPIAEQYTLPMLAKMKRNELKFIGEFGLHIKRMSFGLRTTHSQGFSAHLTRSPRAAYLFKVGRSF